MKNTSTQPAYPGEFFMTAGVAGLLLIGPWIKTSLSFFILEAVGLLLLTMVFVLYRRALPIPASVTVFIFTSILLLGSYLIPVPMETWLNLPGREFYRDVTQLLAKMDYSFAWHSISVEAYASAQMLLSILPALGIFLVTATLSTKNTLRVSQIFIALAVCQGLWGLAQSSMGGSATGSYNNRDHYVALLELTLPLTISLLLFSLSSRPRKRQHHPLAWMGSGIYGLAATIILLGGLFSLSRAGIGGLVLALFFLLLIFIGQFRIWHSIIGISIFIAIITFFLSSSERSLTAALNRFLAADPLKDARWHIFEQAWVAIKHFSPLGSGPGTSKDVYTAFQPHETLGSTLIHHIHNDYLELFLETGMIGAFILFTFVVLYMINWFSLIKTAQKSDISYYLKVGAGIGLLTSLFHAYFDFNYHTYAHPLQVAFLCGIFFVKNRHTGNQETSKKQLIS